jgi:hypothetical protein
VIASNDCGINQKRRKLFSTLRVIFFINKINFIKNFALRYKACFAQNEQLPKYKI